MQRLSELLACFRIYGVCIPCGRMEPLDIAALLATLGENATVTDARQRLRCRQCGLRRPDLRVVYVGADALAAAFSYRREDGSR